MSDFSPAPDRTGFEPELGGMLRDSVNRTGFEPELGGILRQKGAYVDETTCIGCRHCAHTAPNTFYMEPNYGRARVFNQNGDSEALVEEAIDTCPVNCIHWIDFTDLKQREEARKYQVIRNIGLPPNVRRPDKKRSPKKP